LFSITGITPDFFHNTREFETHDLSDAWWTGIFALSLKSVGAVEAEGSDFDEAFCWLCLRFRD
jgi:hypothetical protein